VKEPVVSDSTCLIGLERIGEVNILPQLFDPIMILPEVEREFGNKFSWLQIENLTSSVLVAALQLTVDAGEAEAIALASEKSCLLISDDKQARSAAKLFSRLYLIQLMPKLRLARYKIDAPHQVGEA